MLERIAPNLVFALDRVVAVAMVKSHEVGLAALAPIEEDKLLAGHHRVAAVRAQPVCDCAPADVEAGAPGKKPDGV